MEDEDRQRAQPRIVHAAVTAGHGVDTGGSGRRELGLYWADPDKGIVYVLSINVPSIYKLSTEAPGPGGGDVWRACRDRPGPDALCQKCETCHGSELRGNGNYPSLVDITARMGPDPLREVITGGRPGMPPNNDLNQAEIDSLIAFLGSPSPAVNSEAVARDRDSRLAGRWSHQEAHRAGGLFLPGVPAEWWGRRIRLAFLCPRFACTPATAWTAQSSSRPIQR